MNVMALTRYALGLAATAILTACALAGSPQSPGSGGTQALPQSAAPGQTLNSLYRPLGARTAMNVHPDHSRSWMSPDAKRKVLLYVGDEDTDDVYIFSYPEGKLEGTLTGLGSTPFGECTDKAGDVWVTVGLLSEVVEYAHGGTKAIATLNDPGQGPYGCAVDPKTGDLAVANFAEISPSGPGSISVYAKANGTPKVYADPNSANEYFDYYVNDTLYVVGTNSTTGEYQLAAFANKKFTDLTVSGATIDSPGGIGFDNGLWIGDGGNGSSSNIYQITVSGTTATVIGTTPLTGGRYCGQELAEAKVALCPSGGTPDVYFYNYPAGGGSYKSIDGFEAPYGLAISK